MDSSLAGSSLHGILQVRILEWVVIPFSRVSSQHKDRTQVSCISHRFFTFILAALNFVWSRSILFSHLLVFSCSVQFSSVTQSFLTLCNPMNRSKPGLLIHHKLPESTQPISTESVMPSNHLLLCHPLLSLPSIFPSIRVFSNESALRISWPKFWSFSFKISSNNEHPGLISLA